MNKKPTYEELEQRVKHLEALVESTPLATVQLTEDNVITGINLEFTRVFGFEPNDAIGKHIDLLISTQEYKEEAEGLTAQTLEGDTIHKISRRKRKDGTLIDVEIFAGPLKVEGKILGCYGHYKDITEQKKLEKSLQEREEKFKHLFIEAQVALFRTRISDGALLEVNERYARMAGYSTIQECMTNFHPGKSWADPKERDDLMKILEQEGSVKDFETKIIRGDGVHIWIKFSATIYKEKGYLEGSIVEISTRKQAEKALKEVNTILNRSPSVAFTWKNQEGWPVEFVSENVARIFGYTAKEFISGEVTYIECVHKDDLERVIEEVTSFSVENGRIEFKHEPYRIVTKNGNIKFVNDWTFIVRDEDGNISHYKGIIEDITEQKQTEERLKEREEIYRQLFDSVNDAILIVPFEKKKIRSPYIDANKLACKRYGYIREEFLKMTPYDLNHEDMHNALPIIQEKLLTAGHVLFESIHVTKDGEKIPVEIHANSGKLGNMNVILSIVRNISERKNAEETKRSLESKLAQAQKMEAIGVLAGGIAHDFNNILTGIMGFAELAIMATEKGSEAEQNIKKVLKSGNRASGLVKQILSFSRREGKELKPLKPSLIVKETIKLLRAALPTTIEIRPNINSNSLINGDHTEIHQILLNLCTNAGHAMQEKGGVLEISLNDVKISSSAGIDLHYLMPGNYLELTVKDTGGGIDKAIVDKIFDPYFTTKEIGTGTGLGLSIVHGIVHNYGGLITVDSKSGEGSTFRILLPVIKGYLSPEMQINEELKTGTERILIVDDEPFIVEYVEKMLKKLGYKPVAVNSSVDALQIFRKKPDEFDLVITDMTMPNMTGKDLAKELLTIRPDIPVIICTGFSDYIDEDKAIDMGIKAFVMKPIVTRDMANTIREVLDKMSSS